MTEIDRMPIDEPQKQDVMRAPVRRMTSRSQLIRQSSAALLRHDAPPSLLRKTSGAFLFPEDDVAVSGGFDVFYFSGWEAPHLHYSVDGAAWTAPPGVAMQKCAANETPPNAEGETVWKCHIDGLDSIEFVPNSGCGKWDKAPHNRNYEARAPARYILRAGRVQEWAGLPSKPALARAEETGSSHVVITWNPPIINMGCVAGYNIYRDRVKIAAVGEDAKRYRDSALLGLCSYVYHVTALNSLGEESSPSDEFTVSTAEPGRPSAPVNLQCLKTTTTSVEICWQRADDDGGAPVEFYRIYRNGELLASHQCTGGDGERWSDSHVTADETYCYHVSACQSLEVMSVDAIKRRESLQTAGLTLSECEDADDFVKRCASLVKEKQCNGEGLLTLPLMVVAEAMLELPRLHDGKTHIVLQAFNWRSADNRAGWWNVLLEKSAYVTDANFTMVWLPPPCKSVARQGYMPTKYYDLDTAYGTETELRTLIRFLRGAGVSAMLDLVINHRCGTIEDSPGNWTIFERPDWGPWAIVSNNVQGYEGMGAADTGAQSDCAPDIDHTNIKVRNDIKAWTAWLKNEIGFSTVRIDMAPGYSVHYQVDYIDHLGTPFTVGEYWSGDANVLHNYTSGCRGKIAVYDFSLYYILRRCVEGNNYSELNHNGKINAFVGRDPERAVTFIENHDTEHLEFVGKFANGRQDAVLRGYAFILTAPGTPCVYWNHLADYGDECRRKLTDLCNARRTARIISTSGIHIDRSEHNLWASYVSHDRWCHKGGGTLAVKIGSTHWEPEGGRWQRATGGHDYSVWVRQ